MRGDDVVTWRNTRTARHRPDLEPVEMQVRVTGGLMIRAGADLEISRDAGDAGEIGGVAGGVVFRRTDASLMRLYKRTRRISPGRILIVGATPGRSPLLRSTKQRRSPS